MSMVNLQPLRMDTGRDYQTPAWVAAFLLFGVGDVVTTVIGISMFGGTEANLLVAPLVEGVGLWVLVPLKALVLSAFGAAWYYGPDLHRAGIPYGLLFLGTVVFAWNAAHVYLAWFFRGAGA